MTSRRTFLIGAAGLITAAFIDRAQAHIEHHGRPLLSGTAGSLQNLHIHEDGMITWGPYDDTLDNEGPRPTYRDCIAIEGAPVHDPEALALYVAKRGLLEEELDEPISDVCWPMAYDLTFSPPARAFRLLWQLGIGPGINTRKPHLGRLTFHTFGAHPMSSDFWVTARDELSVTLLEARLIELGRPHRIVMETDRIQSCVEYDA